MGQFTSKAFDGDPYIDIMRALPEREIIWWVSKVIWLAEGFTFLEHFCRTYPDMMLYKCSHCNGAGTIICPACRGYKIKVADPTSAAFRLPDGSPVSKMLARSDIQECQHCGKYCEWDAESEWEGKWNDWEKKLAYYDRTHGALFDEWYEDLLGEGQVDAEMEPLDLPMPDADDDSLDAKLTRKLKKSPQHLEALMRRYGGHPYDEDDLMPYQATDPARSVIDQVLLIQQNMNYLPPELNPTAFPELIDPERHTALDEHYRQINLEDAILSNLDAAMRDAPKLNVFLPTAGTVPCPECEGNPWHRSILPNVAKLTRTEVPFGLRTLQRMSQYWYQSDPTGNERQYGEVPRKPVLDSHTLQQALQPAGPPRDIDNNKKAIRFFQEMARQKEQGPRWFSEFGTRMTAEDDPNHVPDPNLDSPTLFSEADPLSEDPFKALDGEDIRQSTYRNLNPLSSGTQVWESMKAEANTPARRLARDIRDARILGAAEGEEEREIAATYLQARASTAHANGLYDPYVFTDSPGTQATSPMEGGKRRGWFGRRKAAPAPAVASMTAAAAVALSNGQRR